MSWSRYERETAQKHNGCHIGEPGKPDYVRGLAKGEIKHLNRPLTKPEVIKLRKKGVTEIHSLNGYTRPALEHVATHALRLKLFSRGRRIV